MAKTKKKRKYVKQEQFHTIPKIETATATNEASYEQPRASAESYIFVDECKMLVRNLNDYKLNLNATQVLNEIEKTQRQLEMFQNVWSNMLKEQRYRGLK